MSLSDDLKSLPTAADKPGSRRAGVIYSNNGIAEITISNLETVPEEAQWRSEIKDATGLEIPENESVQLVQVSYWGEADNLKHSCRFKIVPRSFSALDTDLEKLHASARKKAPRRKIKNFKDASRVVVLADAQIGKTSGEFGTEETLARLTSTLDELVKLIKKNPSREIVLVDAGDAMEMFESSPNAARTNDLQATEQIRVWRRILWTWTSTLAPLCEQMTVISVPSNHTRTRIGKAYVGPANDDYGLEVLAQVKDIAANNSAFSHVNFVAPASTQESVAHTLLMGKVLGVVHGHQVSNADRLINWWAGQALGETPAGVADILIAGHFHNFQVRTAGRDKWLFVAPASEPGSDYFTQTSGHSAAAHVLTFLVDEHGWHSLSLE